MHSISSETHVMVIAGIHPLNGKILQILNLKDKLFEIKVEIIFDNLVKMVSTNKSKLWGEKNRNQRVKKWDLCCR